MPEPRAGARARRVLPIGQMLKGTLHDAAAIVAVTSPAGTADAVVRQELLVAIDADEVLECAGQPRLLVGLQLREVDNDVGLDHLACNQVLMTARRVRAGQQPRVVASYAETTAVVGDRLEQTLAAQVEEHKTVRRLEVFRRHADAVHDRADSAPKIADAFESWFAPRKLFRPRVKTHPARHLREVARLKGSVADHDFRRARTQSLLYGGAYQRNMGDERLHSPRPEVFVHHEVRLDEHARAARDDVGDRAFIGAPRPAEELGEAPERRPSFIVRRARRFRIVTGVRARYRHARIECDFLKRLRHRFGTSAATTWLTTGRHLLAFVRGMLSTSTTDTSMPGRLADIVESIAPRLSSLNPLRGTMRNCTE